jgi:hypothetical protein
MKLIEYDKIITVGERNKNMEVIESPKRVPYRKRFLWRVKIKCDCGCEQSVECSYWVRGRYKMCRDCQLIGPNNYAWNGCGEISGEMFSTIRRNAQVRKLKYSISKQYLWNLFLKQDRKCKLSGLLLTFSKSNPKRTIGTTASLDRINSSKGYVEGNVQWIHKDINKMKNSYDERYYVSICKRVSEYCGRPTETTFSPQSE